jgi:WD40-like Beta Propeller Repeat
MDAMAMSPTRSASGLYARRRTHPRLRLRSGLPTWLSLLMVVAACSTNQVNEQPVTNLPLPPSGYSGLAWLLGGTLVIADPGRLTEDTTSRLLFLDELSTGDYTAVSAKSEGCLVREFHSPVALSNGSVAFQELCGVEVPGRLPAEEWSLRQFKGPTEQDLPFLLNRPLNFFPGPFSVSPSLNQAIVSVGDAMCGSLLWLDDGGVRYPDIAIEGDGKSWNLGSFFADTSTHSCTDQGRASWPAWSPDGSHIAFFGSPGSAGVAAQARLDVPWNLYVIPPAATKARPILVDIADARALSWSPDGRWLAFSGGLEGLEGTWLFDTSNNHPIAISASQANALAWSPAGDQIAATMPFEQEGVSLDSKIAIFNLRDLV